MYQINSRNATPKMFHSKRKGGPGSKDKSYLKGMLREKDLAGAQASNWIAITSGRVSKATQFHPDAVSARESARDLMSQQYKRARLPLGAPTSGLGHVQD